MPRASFRVMFALFCALVTHVHANIDLVGLDEIVGDGETINSGSKIWEVSGLTHNNNKDYPIIYGTCDTVVWSGSWPKSIYVFNFTFNLDTITSLTATDSKNETYYTVYGIELQDPYYQLLYESDTENIVYFEDKSHNNSQYFIVMTEGYRKYQKTAVWLYDYNGCWIGDLAFNLDIFEMRYDGDINGNFQETWGFSDGHGVESMSITGDFTTVIFIASAPLVQDSVFCNTCVKSFYIPFVSKKAVF